MRSLLTILVVGLVACGMAVNAGAQAKFGMGVELFNQSTMIWPDVSYYFEGDELVITDVDLETNPLFTALTPSILFTIQATPAVFIEPSIGFHRWAETEEETGEPKVESSGQDISFGLGVIYALKPDVTVSPMVHPMFNMHMLKGKVESSGVEAEVSTTALSLGLGVGGLVNLKETLYMTAEARLMFTKVGDLDKSAPGYTDDTDTSQSMFNTDMAIGIRFVF